MCAIVYVGPFPLSSPPATPTMMIENIHNTGHSTRERMEGSSSADLAPQIYASFKGELETICWNNASQHAF